MLDNIEQGANDSDGWDTEDSEEQNQNGVSSTSSDDNPCMKERAGIGNRSHALSSRRRPDAQMSIIAPRLECSANEPSERVSSFKH